MRRIIGSATPSLSGLGLFALLICQASAAMEPRQLSGPPFSDPNHLVTMPTEWHSRPIQRPTNIDIAVTLDQHLYPALLPLIDRFSQQHKLRIAVQEGTCGISAGALLEKKADIGGFCCPAGDTDRLPGLRFHTIGIATLALIVNPANPLQDLSLQQAQDVFRGRIAYWDQLGVALPTPNALIVAAGRLHCKNRPGHWRLLLDNEDQFSPQLHETGTIPDMITDVAANPAAIGYETLWMTRYHAAKGSVRPLRLNGVSADDPLALLDGRYPLYRTYNITTWSNAPDDAPQAAALVSYLLANAEQIDPRYGIVPAARLRQSGWRFRADELIGGPR